MKNLTLGMDALLGAKDAKMAARENATLAQRVLGEDVDMVVELKSQKDKEVNLTNAYSIIASLAKLGYVAGSKIGQIISLTCVCETLKDEELCKQFLVKGSNKMVDMHKLSLVFPNIGQGDKSGYETVFTKEEQAVVTDKLGRTQTILLACKDKIAEFAKALEETACLNIEDLYTIGRDLEIVATVMSELEIDAAKDEEKRAGMIDISEFMNEFMTQNSRKFAVVNNFDEVKAAKRERDNDKTKAMVDLNLSLTTGKSLFEYEEVLAEVEREYEEVTSRGEKYVCEKFELPSLALKMCSVKDPLFEMNERLLNVLNAQMKKLGECYNVSDMDLFTGFDMTPVRNEALNKYKNESIDDSVVVVKKTAIAVYDIISNIYKYKKYMSLAKVEEVATLGRNMIYSTAADRGIAPEDAFFLAVDAAWLKVSNGKLNQRGYFRYRACEAVFRDELKCHFNAEAMCKEVEIEVPDELLEVEDLFQDNKIFDFKDGSCEIEGLDGEYYSLLRIDDMYFTGKVLMKIDEEGYITFMEELNPYKYEKVDFFLLDSIADMNLEANRLDGQALNELTAQDSTNIYAFGSCYNKSRIVDTIRFDTEEKHILEFANKVAPALEKFDNTVKFAVSMSDRFVLKPSCRATHIYMKDTKTEAARMVGELLNFRLTKQLKDCTNMNVISTPAGAMIVVK